MRPLPFKVWKERRSMVRVCWLDGSVTAAGKVARTNSSTSWASPMKISSSSASMAASPSGCARSAGASAATGAATRRTGAGAAASGSTSNRVSPATCFSNGTSSKRPAAASKRKRLLGGVEIVRPACRYKTPSRRRCGRCSAALRHPLRAGRGRRRGPRLPGECGGRRAPPGPGRGSASAPCSWCSRGSMPASAGRRLASP